VTAEFVEKVEDGDADDGVDGRQNQLGANVEQRRLIKEGSLQHPVHELVKDVEDEAKKETYHRMLDVELNPD
jgi:hypothetical protein